MWANLYFFLSRAEIFFILFFSFSFWFHIKLSVSLFCLLYFVWYFLDCFEFYLLVFDLFLSW